MNGGNNHMGCSAKKKNTFVLNEMSTCKNDKKNTDVCSMFISTINT